MAVGIPLQIQELTTWVVALRVTDSCGLVAVDPMPFVSVNQYGIPLHMSESVTIVVTDLNTNAGDDVLALSLSEAPAILVAQASNPQDSILIGLSESLPAIAIPFAVTDSLKVMASDATPTVNTAATSLQFIAAVDSCAVRASDPMPAMTVSVGATDNVSLPGSAGLFVLDELGNPILDESGNPIPDETLGWTESTSIFAFIPQQFVSISVSDTCVIQVPTLPINTIAKSASDSCQIQAVEPVDTSAAIIPATDTLAVRISLETPTLFTTGASTFSVAASDSSALGVSDPTPATVQTTWEQAFAVTDTAALGCSDVLTLTFNLITLSSSDTLLLGVQDDPIASPVASFSSTESCLVQAVEAFTLLGLPNVSDSLTAGLADASPLIEADFSFHVTDTCVVQASEAATFPALQAVVTSDSLTVQASDGPPLIASAVLASESLGLTVNDASLLLLKFMQLTDALVIPVSDVSSLFSDFVQLVAHDSATIQAVDTTFFVQQLLTQLSTTDSCGIGLSEVPDIFSQQSLDDSVLIAAQELVDVLSMFFATDDLAYRIASEDVGILNPFVINAFIAVEDSLAVREGDESANGEPFQIGFFTSDVASLGLDDVALKENLELPEIQDFMIDISFQQRQNPQSYRILQGKSW